jgi:hypothetical protein
MKPVKQTKFGPIEGNCFAACLASILELAIEEVNCDLKSEGWWENLQAWLRPKNLYFLEVTIEKGCANYPLYSLPGIMCIFCGKSPRQFGAEDNVNHCIVGIVNSNIPNNEPVIFENVHDPHPDNTFLKDDSLFGLGFFIALDPSQPTNPLATSANDLVVMQIKDVPVEHVRAKYNL